MGYLPSNSLSWEEHFIISWERSCCWLPAAKELRVLVILDLSHASTCVLRQADVFQFLMLTTRNNIRNLWVLQGLSRSLSSMTHIQDCSHFTQCSFSTTASKMNRAALQSNLIFHTFIFLLWRKIASLWVSHSVIMLETNLVRLDHTWRLPEKTQQVLCIKILLYEAQAHSIPFPLSMIKFASSK